VSSASVDVTAKTTKGRALKLVAVVVVVVLAIEVARSFPWPHIFPRAAFLPKPAVQTWYDECNGRRIEHGRYFVRDGLIWQGNVDTNSIGCVPS
jgi:hypothetical protein